MDTNTLPNKYNPNTGQLLNKGETVQIGNTGQNVTEGQYGTTPVITPDMLNPKPDLKLPEKVVDTTASDYLAKVDATQQTEAEKAIEKAKTDKSKQETDISQILKDIALGQSKVGQYATELGADTKQKSIDDINSQIAIESRATSNYINRLKEGGKGLTTDLVNRMATEQERKSASYIADLEITKSILQKDIDRANTLAQKKVDIELAPKKAELESKKFIYDNNKDFFNEAQKARLNSLIKKDENKIKKEEDRLTEGNKILVNAYQNNTPAELVTKAKDILAKGGTVADVTSVLGNYSLSPSDKIELALKNVQISKAYQDIAESKAKIAKDYPAANATPADTIGQITFLKNSITKAKELAPVSGRSGARQYLGEKIQGANKFTELQTLTDTLKTNILTMMVDPSIKKFFGPQMTNRDVELMTAGGSTLNPEKQTPEAMKAELERLQDFFDRAEKAVKQGTATELYKQQVTGALEEANNPLIKKSK